MTVGYQGQAFAERRQRLGVAGILGELRPCIGQQARDVERPAGRPLVSDLSAIERRRRQAGAPHLQVDPERQHRHQQAERGRQELVQQRARRRRPQRLGRRPGGQDAPFDLDARRRAIGPAHPAGRLLALELGELIAVDRKLTAQPIAMIHASLEQRPEQRPDRRRGEQGEEKLEH